MIWLQNRYYFKYLQARDLADSWFGWYTVAGLFGLYLGIFGGIEYAFVSHGIHADLK